MIHRYTSLFISLSLICGTAHAGTQALELTEQTLELDGTQAVIQAPAGMRVEVLTSGLDGPRMLTFHPGGDLFIGSRSGNVYRLKPPYTQPQVFAKLNQYPHSVAFRDDWVYVARTDGVFRTPYEAHERPRNASDFEMVAELPGGSGHSSRTLTVGPDDRLYVSLGISGNCSDQYIGEGYDFDDRRGGVMVLDESVDPPQWQAFGSGLRNPVGLAWQPQTGQLYATNNGPDHWGYEQPPEVFTRLSAGSYHGMPWFQHIDGELVADACITSQPPRSEADVTAPLATLPARSAPLGLAFVPMDSPLEPLAGDAVIAVHGSWATQPGGGSGGNPSTRRAPKLTVVRFASVNEIAGVEDLVTGLQEPDGRRWLRPAGVAAGPDGNVYFTSDADHQGLYRLSIQR